MSPLTVSRYTVGDYVTTPDGRTGLVTLDMSGWLRLRFHHGPPRHTPREETWRDHRLSPAAAEDEARLRAEGVVIEAERSYVPQAVALR